jgi:hypothetical protein
MYAEMQTAVEAAEVVEVDGGGGGETPRRPTVLAVPAGRSLPGCRAGPRTGHTLGSMAAGVLSSHDPDELAGYFDVVRSHVRGHLHDDDS